MTYNSLTPETIAFLNHLHRGGQYAYWWTIDEADTYRDRNGLWQKRKRTHWFTAGQPTNLPQVSSQHIYFGVYPTNKRGSDRTRVMVVTVAAMNCLFAEFDAKHFAGGMDEVLAHVDTLEPPPSVIVHSGGGLHCYWLLDQPHILTDENRQQAKELLKRWVTFVRGDEASKDLARVLRVPGTRNVKPEYGPEYPIVSFKKLDMSLLYAIDELAAFIPQSERPRSSEKKTYATSNVSDRRVRAYTDAAVRAILQEVKTAPDGQKHFTLRAAACRMGNLVGAGWIIEGDAEQLLKDAIQYRASDLGIASKTIKSGIALGKEEPAQIPEREPAEQPRRDTSVMVRVCRARVDQVQRQAEQPRESAPTRSGDVAAAATFLDGLSDSQLWLMRESYGSFEALRRFTELCSAAGVDIEIVSQVAVKRQMPEVLGG
jgi:hypothetical protein